MGIKFKNNASAQLSSGISSSATSLTVKAGQGDRFPSVSGSDYFLATLVDSSGNREIVRVTSRSVGSDSMTIVRAQEGTAARNFSSDDVVELRLTAGTLEAIIADMNTADTALSNSINSVLSSLNTHKSSEDHDDRYHTQAQISSILGDYVTKSALATAGSGVLVSAANLQHRNSILHSEITDNEPEKHRLINDSSTASTSLWSAQKINSSVVDIYNQLANKAPASHTHDDRYYPISSVNSLLAGKANASHSHVGLSLTKSESERRPSEITFNSSAGDVILHTLTLGWNGSLSGTVTCGVYLNHGNLYLYRRVYVNDVMVINQYLHRPGGYEWVILTHDFNFTYFAVVKLVLRSPNSSVSAYRDSFIIFRSQD